MNPNSSRTKKFLLSLVSGYGLIGANILYAFLTVPIALHYLSRAEFGLWALITQITGYIALVDLGMSGSVARTLVDHKDRREDGIYGSIVQTNCLVGGVQCLIIVAVSFFLAHYASGWLNVDAALRETFVKLVIAQGWVLGAGFVFRCFSLMCLAHQRYDVVNNASSIQQILGIGVMWAGFSLGAGIFSLIWSSVICQIVSIALTFRGCVRLQLLPAKGEWGRPTWPLFSELFAFGRDVFMWTLGAQLLNASQMILITRVLGLEEAAVWSIAVRGYNLLGQFIFRIFDFASSAFAEMIIRNELQRLLRRFRSVVIVSSSLAAVSAVAFALLNQPFIEVWTSGRISWAMHNDVLLGIMLVLQTVMRTHSGLVGQTKKLEAFRYMYFVEGLFFVAGSLLVLPHLGITGMICMSIVGTILFSLRYGFYRTCRYFTLPAREVVFEWTKPMARVLAWLVPLGLLCNVFLGNMPAIWRLPAIGAAIGIPGLWLFLRYGMEDDLKQDLLCRVPPKAVPILSFLLRGRRAS